MDERGMDAGEATMAAAADGMGVQASPASQEQRAIHLAHLTLLHVAPPRFVSVAAEAGYDGVSLHLTPPRLSDPGAVSYPMLGNGSVMALWLLWGYPNVPGAAALSVLLIVFLAIFITPLQIYVSRLTDRASV